MFDRAYLLLAYLLKCKINKDFIKKIILFIFLKLIYLIFTFYLNIKQIG